MEFFFDIVDIEQIWMGFEWGMVDGVMMNLLLIVKQGKVYLLIVCEIVEFVFGFVSGEVIVMDVVGMFDEGKCFVDLVDNVVVKIFLFFEGFKVVVQFIEQGIKINVIFCFLVNQVLFVVKVGVIYILFFVGCFDDIGFNGMELILDIVCIYVNYVFGIKVLVVLVCSLVYMYELVCFGVDIVMLLFKMFEQFYKYLLIDCGLVGFFVDWEVIGCFFDEEQFGVLLFWMEFLFYFGDCCFFLDWFQRWVDFI